MKEYVTKLVKDNHHGSDSVSDGTILDCIYAILDEPTFNNDNKVAAIHELLHNEVVL